MINRSYQVGKNPHWASIGFPYLVAVGIKSDGYLGRQIGGEGSRLRKHIFKYESLAPGLILGGIML